ncbi:MAG: hypothetical protein M1816_004751 [Peltula sp. TS41687]|nr:MAG: hypothetical protein M1816_004751 [Peltula sp. TS41687]
MDVNADDEHRARVYCSNVLRKYDLPSYILQTFIPPSARDAYLAIRAFNVSVSSVADNVSNPTVGAMRMQFWRETISQTFKGIPPREPVAILLSQALKRLEDRRINLNKGWFLRLISSREQYLHNPPYPTISALESYAESTYSTMLYLTLSSLPVHSVTVDHLASHIGKASGIAAVLRGLPLLAFPSPQHNHMKLGALERISNRQGSVPLPLDVMAETGLKEEDVFRQGASAPGLQDAVFAVATRANDHLITAREMLKNLRAGQDIGHEFEHEDDEGHNYSAHERSKDPVKDLDRGFGVLMPAVATSLWLDALERVGFDIFRPELRRSDWRLPWKAYWSFKRRKI